MNHLKRYISYISDMVISLALSLSSLTAIEATAISAEETLSDRNYASFIEQITKPIDTSIEMTDNLTKIEAGRLGDYIQISFYGLAIETDSIDQVIAEGIGDYQIVWSEGAWGLGGLSASECLLQPVTGFASVFGCSDELVSGTAQSQYGVSDLQSISDCYLLCVGPSKSTDNSGHSRIIFDYTNVIKSIANDNRIVLRGAVNTVQKSPVLFDRSDPCVYFEADELLTKEYLEAYGIEAEKYSTDSNRYKTAANPDCTPLELMETYQRISNLDLIKNAYVGGAVEEDVSLQSRALQFIPYLSKSSEIKVYQGDLDGDGMITADDAVLALKGANEITAETEANARTLTPAQEAAGDVDGDGELTAFDAFCILKYFNLREVAEVEDLTWADVLPAK